MQSGNQYAQNQQTLPTDHCGYQGLRELVEPIASIIAAADDTGLVCAAVFGELFSQVASINRAAQSYIHNDGSTGSNGYHR
jgi:hypothetical protein